MGGIWSQKNNRVDLIKPIFCLEIYQSKLNKMGEKSSKKIGWVDFMPLIFRLQIGQFPNVVELFHRLTQPPLNHNLANATSSRYKSQLNTIG
jgi:hypothetical protein